MLDNIAQQTTSTSDSLIHTSTTAIFTTVFYRVLSDSVIWLIVAVVLIICDLYFGIEASIQRKEPVRFSRACRRTINKTCEYLCWIMLAITLSISFDADWLKNMIFAVVYGIELSSCFSNYFAAHGKKVNINIFKIIGRKLGLDELSDITIEEEETKK